MRDLTYIEPSVDFEIPEETWGEIIKQCALERYGRNWDEEAIQEACSFHLQIVLTGELFIRKRESELNALLGLVLICYQLRSKSRNPYRTDLWLREFLGVNFWPEIHQVLFSKAFKQAELMAWAELQ